MVLDRYKVIGDANVEIGIEVGEFNKYVDEIQKQLDDNSFVDAWFGEDYGPADLRFFITKKCVYVVDKVGEISQLEQCDDPLEQKVLNYYKMDNIVVKCTLCGETLGTIKGNNMCSNRINWLKSMFGHAHAPVCKKMKDKIIPIPETYLYIEFKEETQSDILEQIERVVEDIEYDKNCEAEELIIHTYYLDDKDKRAIEKVLDFPEYSLYEISGIIIE